MASSSQILPGSEATQVKFGVRQWEHPQSRSIRGRQMSPFDRYVVAFFAD